MNYRKIAILLAISPLFFSAVFAASLVIASHARPTGPDQYSRYEAGMVSFAESGMVMSTRSVKISGMRTGIGG